MQEGILLGFSVEVLSSMERHRVLGYRGLGFRALTRELGPHTEPQQSLPLILNPHFSSELQYSQHASHRCSIWLISNIHIRGVGSLKLGPGK